MEAAGELRALARVERDPRRRVRLLALANVREGMSVAAAARATGMGRATLYRGLAREQAGGPGALGRGWTAGHAFPSPSTRLRPITAGDASPRVPSPCDGGLPLRGL